MCKALAIFPYKCNIVIGALDNVNGGHLSAMSYTPQMQHETCNHRLPKSVMTLDVPTFRPRVNKSIVTNGVLKEW